MKIRENVPLSDLTTMRLGGPARFVLDVETEADIPAAFEFAKNHDLPFFILGSGANTIAHDEGFAGVIIRNAIIGIVLQSDSDDSRPYATNGERNERSSAHNDGPERTRRELSESDYFRLTIMGGTPWDAAVAYTTERGLTGIEALSKIPGLSGAAPVQNIGAYGQDVSQTFKSAYVYDTKDGIFKTLYQSDFGFSYRKSILNTADKNRYFIVSIALTLKKGEMPRPFYNSIEKYITEHDVTDFSPKSIRDIVTKIRADKLPDPKTRPSAGSFFKNVYLTEEEAAAAEAKGYPVYHGHDGFKINSGWLIEQCGLKGALLHGIRVNDKAALVLINESAKSYDDLAAARAEIIAKVQEKFGYHLEQEPVEL